MRDGRQSFQAWGGEAKVFRGKRNEASLISMEEHKLYQKGKNWARQLNRNLDTKIIAQILPRKNGALKTVYFRQRGGTLSGSTGPGLEASMGEGVKGATWRREILGNSMEQQRGCTSP